MTKNWKIIESLFHAKAQRRKGAKTHKGYVVNSSFLVIINTLFLA